MIPPRSETRRYDGEPTPPPPEAVVMQLATGAWVTKTISEVTRLNVPDLLKRHGPRTARQLTSEHGVTARPDVLQRALRACASLGIFSEDAGGAFGPTPLSDVLTAGSPVSVKKMVEITGASWWRMWSGLGEAFRTGAPQAKAQLGMEYWDYCKANPKEMEDFGEAMKSNSVRSTRGVLAHCDLSGVKKIVDIGGGFGHLVIALLERYRDLQGLVLDVPDLIPIARTRLPVQDQQLASRLRYVGGDMFDDVPSADAYLIKHIIHDWDDARCHTLLRNCHARMEGEGRVICVDAVLPSMGDASGTAAKFLDLMLLVATPGKERTKAQWEALFDGAGFTIRTITPLQDNFGTSLIEGVKA